jgi:hypothetical protein
MRGAEVDAGNDLESSCMLRQRGIGVRQDHRAQLLIAGRGEFRWPPGARLLGQRLAAAMARSPAKYRPSIDAEQSCRFTGRQAGVKGRHQALAEVGRGARSHAPSCHRGTSYARCSSGLDAGAAPGRRAYTDRSEASRSRRSGSRQRARRRSLPPRVPASPSPGAAIARPGWSCPWSPG